MPKKRFFSDSEPEESGLFGDSFGTEDQSFQFDGSFGEMQPMELFGGETAAADDFATLLQPNEADSATDEEMDFSGLFGAQPAPQPAAFEDLFAGTSNQDDASLFVPGEEYGTQDTAFFAPGAQDDALFGGLDTQGYNDAAQNGFFAADEQEADSEVFLPQDMFAQHSMPTAAPSYEKPEAGFGSDGTLNVPFDIAEPDEEQAEEDYLTEEDDDQQEYVPKRKYKPVFPAPIPSALDELRAGIVRPASPITDIAATQIPVVITAAEAAAAEAAAREAAVQAEAEAVAAGQAAAAAMAKQEAFESEPYEYEATGLDTPSEAGYAYEEEPSLDPAEEAFENAPQADTASQEDTFENYDFDAAQPETQSFDFAAQEPENFAFEPQPSIDEEAFPFDAQAFGTDQQGEEGEFPSFDFEAQAQPAEFDFDPNGGLFEAEAPEGAAAFTPEAFAENLHAMLGTEQDNLEDTAAGGFEDAMFGNQQNGFDAFGDLEGDFGALQALEDDAQEYKTKATTGNPFESEEWLDDGEGDDKDDGYDDGMPPRGPKKRSPVPLIIALVALLLLIATVIIFVLFGGKRGGAASSSVPSVPSSVSVPESVPEPEPQPVVDPIPRDEWYMKLVNKSSVLPKDYTITVGKTADGVEVDQRIVEPLNQMVADAKAQGINLKVVAGYRTYDRQEKNYNAQVSKFVGQGKTKEEAAALAAEITAPPGTSEHNLGLSADIQSTTSYNYSDAFKDSKEAQWLRENAAKYGFILRYPEGTEDKTGFAFEPWHYRYVGVDQANRIQASGLTLEEYLAQDIPTGIPGAASSEAASSEAAASEPSAAA